MSARPTAGLLSDGPVIGGSLSRVESGAVVSGGAWRLAPAERVTGQTVLGRYLNGEGYTKVADALGARYFSVPDKFWRAMTVAERDAANFRFLDRTILRGDEILLSSNPLIKSNLRGSFAKEIEYMVGTKGYKISSDGWRLLPPGTR